jgi:hypothetical protein
MLVLFVIFWGKYAIHFMQVGNCMEGMLRDARKSLVYVE